MEQIITTKNIKPRKRIQQNICVDKGYKGQEIHNRLKKKGYVIHMQQKKRWIVETMHSWFNNFRKIKTRYEKTNRSFLALHKLASALMIFRRVIIIYG